MVDTSWVKPGMSVRVGKLSKHVDPVSTLTFSKNYGASGSVIKVEGDYATIYIATNITSGKQPQERVPLIQCERI